jgi:sulfur-carrier protein
MTASGNPTRQVSIRYFAWVREKTGRSEETVEIGPGILTISDLVAWLRTRGPEYDAAFSSTGTVRAAIDMTHVKPDAKIASAREIAFFPPVTGG